MSDNSSICVEFLLCLIIFLSIGIGGLLLNRVDEDFEVKSDSFVSCEMTDISSLLLLLLLLPIELRFRFLWSPFSISVSLFIFKFFSLLESISFKLFFEITLKFLGIVRLSNIVFLGCNAETPTPPVR